MYREDQKGQKKQYIQSLKKFFLIQISHQCQVIWEVTVSKSFQQQLLGGKDAAEMMLMVKDGEKKVRVMDAYMDVSLPYNDAKVASKLCVGGPVKYELK